ncbi:MAG: peptide deformylase [Aerococcus sp.]|nr:peptide deformylase [Aerococcus sp.]
MILRDDITKDGHPVLRQHAKKLTFPLSKEDLQLAHDMMEYLEVSQDDELAEKYDIRPGVGYAAPQIAASKQMIALLVPDLEDDEADPLLKGVMVNPRIVSHSVEQICLSMGEGCLSVDEDVPGYVPRYARITVTYDDLDGNHFKKRFKGYAAIVLQHEIDHLNGHLYYDHIDPDAPWTLPNDHTFLLGEEY